MHLLPLVTGVNSGHELHGMDGMATVMKSVEALASAQRVLHAVLRNFIPEEA